MQPGPSRWHGDDDSIGPSSCAPMTPGYSDDDDCDDDYTQFYCQLGMLNIMFI